MVKRLVTPGAVRQPKIRLLIAGKEMPGLISAEVSSNSHFQADTWSCKVAMDAPGGKDSDWWGEDARKDEAWDIRFALDTGGERSLIVGQADELTWDVAAGLISSSGRDLSARLIEASTQEAFQNQTASEIAKTLAARHGLTAVVDPTTELVSRYYGDDHDRVTQGQFSHTTREWDLLKHLAEFEGYNLFVTGTELHFQKQPDPAKLETYGITWDRDQRRSQVVRLQMRRSLTLAKGVVVKVVVHNSAQGRGFTKYSPVNGKALEKKGGVTITVLNRPNLTEQQAQQLADKTRDQITRHQRTTSFDCPGEISLTPRDMVRIEGLGDGWGGQPFYVSTIRREIDMQRGFAMSVEGKNSDPNLEAGA